MDFSSNNKCLMFVLCLFVFVSSCVMCVNVDTQTCTNRKSRCFLKKLPCPAQCPSRSPANPREKVCYLDCDSPMCKTQCKSKIFFMFNIHDTFAYKLFCLAFSCDKFNKVGLMRAC
jgi:hypothetical protein